MIINGGTQKKKKIAGGSNNSQNMCPYTTLQWDIKPLTANDEVTHHHIERPLVLMVG